MTAIVLPGCAALGAVQIAGVKQLGIENPDYYGISSGAFVAAICAQIGPKRAFMAWGQIKKRTDIFGYNLRIWRGLYTFEPLKKIMAPYFSDDPRATAEVSCLSQQTGKQVWFSNQSLSPDRFLDRVLDSGRIAGAVEPATFMDAGPAKLAPIDRAIKKGHRDIFVICGYPPEPEVFEETRVGIKLASQSFSRLLHNQTWDDVRACLKKNTREGFKKINLRVFGPEDYLYDSFDFSQTSKGLKARVVEYSPKRILRAE